MVHADLICVPQLMSGEQALAAQIGGNWCLLGGASRLRRAMEAAGARVVARRCVPVIRRSRWWCDWAAAAAGSGSVSAAARTVR
jgi:hypothetical protein